MNTATRSEVITGRISLKECVMRMVLSLIAIVGVLAGSITGEEHMFAAAVLSIYLGMSAIIRHDPFYYIVEKWMSGHRKSPRSSASTIGRPQPVRISSRQSRTAA